MPHDTPAGAGAAADVDAVVTTARAADPSIEPEPAREIVVGLAQVLAADPGADAAELARRYLADHGAADASWVSHLARALAVG